MPTQEFKLALEYLDRCKSTSHPVECLECASEGNTILASLARIIGEMERAYNLDIAANSVSNAVSKADAQAKGKEPYQNYRYAKGLFEAIQSEVTNQRHKAQYLSSELKNFQTQL